MLVKFDVHHATQPNFIARSTLWPPLVLYGGSALTIGRVEREGEEHKEQAGEEGLSSVLYPVRASRGALPLEGRNEPVVEGTWTRGKDALWRWPLFLLPISLLVVSMYQIE